MASIFPTNSSAIFSKFTKYPSCSFLIFSRLPFSRCICISCSRFRCEADSSFLRMVLKRELLVNLLLLVYFDFLEWLLLQLVLYFSSR